MLTFYFAPDQNPGGIQYDVYGYLPGQYRALPASVRSAYEPGRFHLGQPGDLKVLAPGETNTDPYRQSPDELYARGKAHFDAGRYAEAAAALEPLFAGYTLRDDVAKDAARMLLLINIKDYEPRKVVQYFEVVKEKAPELILSFDQLLVIGQAYRDINEYERAIIVWRGLIEASYLEDARVGELLRQRGKTLEAMAYLIDLWRSYPNTPSIESDFFGLSQVLAQAASKAFTDPNLRRELAAAGVTRSELLLQTIRMIQVFLSQSPTNPMADEASLALVGAFLELEDFKARREARRAVRQALPQEHLPRQLPVQRGPGQLPPRPVRPGRRGGRDDRQGRLQGRRRGRPAQPQQVAGALHPGPDLRRPPRARQGPGVLPPGRRPVHRRGQRDPVLHAQGPEGPRGLGRPARRSSRRSPQGRARPSRQRGAAGIRCRPAADPAPEPADPRPSRASSSSIATSPRPTSRSTPST